MEIFEKIIKIAERVIIVILIGMMAIVLVIAAVEVGVIVVKEFSNPFGSGGVLININGLIEIFSFFLIVLIGFELFETVKMYLRENVFHGEVILLVSLIAVARKVIILDYATDSPMEIFAMAALIASISAGYFLIKKAERKKSDGRKKE